MKADYTISNTSRRKPRALHSKRAHTMLCLPVNKWRRLMIKSLPYKWLRQMDSFRGPRSNFVCSHPLKNKFERHLQLLEGGKRCHHVVFICRDQIFLSQKGVKRSAKCLGMGSNCCRSAVEKYDGLSSRVFALFFNRLSSRCSSSQFYDYLLKTYLLMGMI